MKPTLLILAAGMASRYGSMKQTEGFGPHGETIMDYAIYNAIQAGFGKVVFIIREDFAENFKASFEPKLKGLIDVDYVFQNINSFVDESYLRAGRSKPWGTGHALLCAKDKVLEPFAVINADDFYGKAAFEKAAGFLVNKCSEGHFALVAWHLSNTLSDHGSVSRGVCEVDSNEKLQTITERTKINREGNDIVFYDNDTRSVLAEDTVVSMNYWCFHPSVFKLAEKLFADFPKNNMDNTKAEFFIPFIAQNFIEEENGTIDVIKTKAEWFGVTYKEDAPGVKNSLNKLIAEGEYPGQLWRK